MNKVTGILSLFLSRSLSRVYELIFVANFYYLRWLVCLKRVEMIVKLRLGLGLSGPQETPHRPFTHLNLHRRSPSSIQ